MAKNAKVSSSKKRQVKLSNSKKRQIQQWVQEAERTFFGDAFTQTEQFCNKILQLHPTNPDALGLLGKVALKQGNSDRALEVFLKGIESNPKHLNLLAELAQYYYSMNDCEASARYWQQFIKLKPYNPAVWHFLALAYSGMLELDKATDAVKQAQKLAPKEAAFYVTEGYILELQCRHEEWISCLQKTVELAPQNALFQDYLSQALMSVGRAEEAEAILRDLLQKDPSYAPALYFLLRRNKVTSYNEDMKRAEALLAGDSITVQYRESLLFALGKAWEDLQEYDKSFASYDAANRLKREGLDFNIDGARQYAADIKTLFSKEFIAKHSADNRNGKEFNFIVGMPRSGSTLMSRILSVAPQSFDIGETNRLRDTAGKLTTGNASTINLKKLADMTPEQFEDIGDQYRAILQKTYGTHEMYIDKSLHNFLWIGLIHLLFPNAKIILSSRNPLDNCWSIFANDFFGFEFNYSYSLEEIGKFYHIYEDMMDHWRQVLPEGAFFEARNEEFVANPESETRRLIEFCGLDWDDAYLNFHQSKKAVRTLSLSQVRKPINSSSVERSNRFEKYLQPLIDAMAQQPRVEEAAEKETSIYGKIRGGYSVNYNQ